MKKIVVDARSESDGWSMNGSEIKIDTVDENGTVVDSTFYSMAVLDGTFYHIFESGESVLEKVIDLFDESNHDRWMIDSYEDTGELKQAADSSEAGKIYRLLYDALHDGLFDLPKALDEIDAPAIDYDDGEDEEDEGEEGDDDGDEQPAP